MSQTEGLVFLIVILAISVTCHEFMHAYISDKLGDDTARYSGRLSLNPLAHIDPFTTVLLPILLFLAGLPVFGAAKPVPFNPNKLRNGDIGAAFVALAGPLTNLVLALFVSIWLRLLPVSGLPADFLVLFIEVNIGFFIFNLIPFPPLDGSRVLYAFAPGFRPLFRQIEGFGWFGILAFIFLLFPVISPIIGRLITGLLSILIPGFNIQTF